MSRTLSFRELVKLIHPDHNPHIIDAGGKMRDAVLFKDKPEELYKLAVRWGCVTGATRKPRIKPAPRTHNPYTDRRPNRPTEASWDTGRQRTPRPRAPRPPRYEWRAFLRERPEVNGHVCVNTLGGIRVMVVRVTPKRVYFYHNGRRTYASIKSVHVVREVRF
jgi:hypothetical protein